MTTCTMTGEEWSHRPAPAWRSWPVLVAVALSLAACTPPAGPPAPPEPSPAAAAARDLPTATLADGATVELELALNPEETERGLMFRPSLPANRGMLFLFRETRELSFWMKNTWIPLDIVFLDERGMVVHVEANAQPCAAEPCPHYLSGGPARAVLELAAGSAARHGVAEGARLRFVGVAGYPMG
jgi:uncharacterized protein